MAQTKKVEPSPEITALVPMTNGVVTIEVHPLCVKDHERIGWKVAPTPVAE